MQIKKAAIIGMGALGLLYGNHIADHIGPEAVDFLLGAERYDKYLKKTFEIQGEEKKLPIARAEQAEPYDLVILAVKYGAIESAFETMKYAVGPDTVLLSVMNGITSEDMMGERFGREDRIYTVAQGMGAMHVGGTLRYTKMGELRIGIVEDGKKENLDAVVDFLNRAKIPCVVEENIRKRMWGKFMLNVGINQTCMAYECTYSQALTPGEANDVLMGAMEEVIQISQAEGIGLTHADLDYYVAILKTLDPDGVPSMRQDGMAGRKTEVDMFAGTVIKIAEKHGMDAPVNRFIYKKVKEMESKLC